MIDKSYAARGPSGTAVYLEQLTAALRRRGEVEVVEVRQRRRLRPGGGNPLRSAANALLDLGWLHVGLPRAARAARADLVHHPLPVFSGRIRVPQVVTVHDVAFELMPEGYGRVWRRLARRQYETAVRGAAAVVCVSEGTAEDVAGLYGAPRERLVVAPHGPGQALGELERAEPPRHLLYVGDAQGRKDLNALLEAYADYRRGAERPLDLVLAGRSGRLAGAEGVRAEHSPAGGRLAELLAGAAALVHPSRHEGFGLTLLEAMAAGVPVLAVRNRGTEELGARAALLVERDELAEGLARVAGDAALRKRLAAAGRERAGAFSWEKSARAHERAYTLAART